MRKVLSIIDCTKGRNCVHRQCNARDRAVLLLESIVHSLWRESTDQTQRNETPNRTTPNDVTHPLLTAASVYLYRLSVCWYLVWLLGQLPLLSFVYDRDEKRKHGHAAFLSEKRRDPDLRCQARSAVRSDSFSDRSSLAARRPMAGSSLCLPLNLSVCHSAKLIVGWLRIHKQSIPLRR